MVEKVFLLPKKFISFSFVWNRNWNLVRLRILFSIISNSIEMETFLWAFKIASKAFINKSFQMPSKSSIWVYFENHRIVINLELSQSDNNLKSLIKTWCLIRKHQSQSIWSHVKRKKIWDNQLAVPNDITNGRDQAGNLRKCEKPTKPDAQKPFNAHFWT